MIEQEGETVEAAVEAALQKLGLPKEKVKIEIVAEPRKGVFGLGARPALVRATVAEVGKEKEPAQAETPKAAQAETPKAAAGKEEEFVIGFLDRVLEGICLKSKFKASAVDDKTTRIEITCSDSALLIGKKGKNLEALQYLVTIISNKAGVDRLRFVLDAEGYRGRRKESLTTLAKKVAEDVRKTGRPVSLEPMNSFERRIVHMFLENDQEVMTESTGRGEDRRVVIKPKHK